MRAPKVAFVIALGAGLLTGAGTAQVGNTALEVGRPPAVVESAVTAMVPGRPISVVLARVARPQVIIAGENHTCGLDGDGKAWCWGWKPVAVVGGHTFTSLAPGTSHTCGLDDAGKAWCWGNGNLGALGDGNLGEHETGTPVAVVGDNTFTSLASGDGHTCGLDSVGKAWCWGSGGNEQGGDSEDWARDHSTATPGAVADGHRFTSLAARWGHTCGVAKTGKAWCWLNGSDDPAGAVKGSHKFTFLAAGYGHTCGVDGAGKAWCWGDGGYEGVLGDGIRRDHWPSKPVAVVGGHRFVALTAGWWHTCGIAKNGKAWCWGRGTGGRLGDRDTSKHFTATPVPVVGRHVYTSIAAGFNHSCGIDTTGKAWCWGYNFFDQLGDGNKRGHQTGTPVSVVGGHTFAHP